MKSKDLQGVRRMMATMISRQITEMTAEAMLRLFQCFSLSMPSSRSCCVVCVCVCKGKEMRNRERVLVVKLKSK